MDSPQPYQKSDHRMQHIRRREFLPPIKNSEFLLLTMLLQAILTHRRKEREQNGTATHHTRRWKEQFSPTRSAHSSSIVVEVTTIANDKEGREFSSNFATMLMVMRVTSDIVGMPEECLGLSKCVTPPSTLTMLSILCPKVCQLFKRSGSKF